MKKKLTLGQIRLKSSHQALTTEQEKKKKGGFIVNRRSRIRVRWTSVDVRTPGHLSDETSISHDAQKDSLIKRNSFLRLRG